MTTRHDQWALTMLLRESVRNAFTAGGRLFGMIALASVLGGLLVGADALAAQRLDQQTADIEELGGHVVVLMSAVKEYPALIERASCEALSDLPSVVRAGAVVERAAISHPQLGSRSSMRLVSSTLVPELKSVDVAVGRALADELGIWTRGVFAIQTPGGSVPAHVAKTLHPELGGTRGVFVAFPPAIRFVDRCVVVLHAGASPVEFARILPAMVDVAGGPLYAAPMHVPTIYPWDLYLERVERYLPVLFGVFGAAVAMIITALRGSELAVYRLSGSSRRSLFIILGFESVHTAGVLLAAAVGATAICWQALASPPATVMSAVVAAAVWVSISVAGNAWAVSRSVVAMAKDR